MMASVTPAHWLSLWRYVLANVNRFLHFIILSSDKSSNFSTLQAVKTGQCDPSCVEFEYLCGVCVPPPPRTCPARCEAAANSGESSLMSPGPDPSQKVYFCAFHYSDFYGRLIKVWSFYQSHKES